MAEETIILGTKAENGDTTFTSEELTKFQAKLESTILEKMKQEYLDKEKIFIDEKSKLQLNYDNVVKELESFKTKKPDSPLESKNNDEQNIDVKVAEIVKSQMQEIGKTLGIDNINEFIKDSKLKEVSRGKIAVLQKYAVDTEFYDMLLNIDASNIVDYDAKIVEKLKASPKLLKNYGANAQKGSFDFMKGNQKGNVVEDIIKEAFKPKY